MLSLLHSSLPSVSRAAACARALPSQCARLFSSASEAATPLTETVSNRLNPQAFFDYLQEKSVDFYCGVPDSLLKNFCAYVTDHAAPGRSVITANEGCAIGLASGYHLATKRFPLVFMQNSGIGNCVNPLLSLAAPGIYSIPMLLMIGWRGEPGKKDEPQHFVQGRVTNGLLTEMGINYEVLPDYLEGAKKSIDTAVNFLQTRKAPYAFVVRKECFGDYKLTKKTPTPYALTREDAMRVLVPMLGERDIVVSTTGFASRELYEYRDALKQGHSRDFLTVGSMGHASSIALGLAINKPQRTIWCLDGDGAAIMHMGAMTTIGQQKPQNYRHVVFNNGCHDSVGGQPTAGFNVDFPTIAKASGYKMALSATTAEEIKEAVKKMATVNGPAFLELKVNRGARKNLGRPKTTPAQNKEEFMKFVQN